MALIVTCPSCGFASNEIRCPRCNALKLEGCTGACTTCKSGSCKVEIPSPPSNDALEDAEHPGTPLER